MLTLGKKTHISNLIVIHLGLKQCYMSITSQIKWGGGNTEKRKMTIEINYSKVLGQLFRF